jgi:hypothetical protein
VKIQSGLPAGAYQGTINFTSQGQTRQLAISSTVTAPPIQVQTSALHFTAQKGGDNPADQSLSITNTSSAAIDWTAKLNTASAATPSFLSVSSLSGTLAPGQTVSLTVGVDITNAPAGTLSGTIDIVSSSNASIVLANEVSVDVVISDMATPTVTATPTVMATPAAVTTPTAA